MNRPDTITEDQYDSATFPNVRPGLGGAEHPRFGRATGACELCSKPRFDSVEVHTALCLRVRLLEKRMASVDRALCSTVVQLVQDGIIDGAQLREAIRKAEGGS